MTRIDGSGNYVTEVLPAVLVLGLGLSCTVAPLTTTVLAAAPSRQAGIASAVNNDVARTAGLFAVAILPFFAGLGQASYFEPAAFLQGFRHAVIISAGLCVVGSVVAFVSLRERVSPASVPQPAMTECCVSGTGLRPHTAAGGRRGRDLAFRQSDRGRKLRGAKPAGRRRCQV